MITPLFYLFFIECIVLIIIGLCQEINDVQLLQEIGHNKKREAQTDTDIDKLITVPVK